METPSPESFLTLQKNGTGLTNLTRFNDKFDKEFIVFKHKIQEFINSYHPLVKLKNSRNIELLWDSLAYTQQMHSGQTRSDKITPYFHHVMEVASGFMDMLKPDISLEEAIFGIKVCLFHDVPEDQGDEIIYRLFGCKKESDLQKESAGIFPYLRARFGGISKMYDFVEALEKLTKSPKTAKFDNEQKRNLDSLKNAKSDLFELKKARYLNQKHLDYFEHFLEIIDNPIVFSSKLHDVMSNSFDIDSYEKGADKYLPLIRVFIIVLEFFEDNLKESQPENISDFVVQKLAEGVADNFVLARRDSQTISLESSVVDIVHCLSKNYGLLSVLNSAKIPEIITMLKELERRGLNPVNKTVEIDVVLVPVAA